MPEDERKERKEGGGREEEGRRKGERKEGDGKMKGERKGGGEKGRRGESSDTCTCRHKHTCTILSIL